MEKQAPFYRAGQEVMEGVMMRGRKSIAVAVRRPNGEISLTSQPLPSLYKGRARNWPFVRGIIILIETLALGTQSLLHSAQIAASAEAEGISPAPLWGGV